MAEPFIGGQKPKKAPVVRQKSHSLSGWHPAQVKAAIEMRGQSLTSLALHNGFSESYLRNALIRPLYRGEQIIAAFLGVPAREIWPDRYRMRQTRRAA